MLRASPDDIDISMSDIARMYRYVFTARRYASAVLAVIVCPSVRPSVCPSVCPSQIGVVQRWLNLGSE